MPIYEYKCEACGHYLEALQKLNEAPLTQCPECGQPALHKLISAAGFRLKGSGWYETDFKSGSKRNVVESADKPAASAPAKTDKPEKKPEAKPAEKPASKKPVTPASS
ncbi:MAG: zinc ribbon domain-containing protein [Gammaproteobacteria bacterium]|nr:zinc ribbon domain-containing protein [Gammaproteobacteria bacterium]